MRRILVGYDGTDSGRRALDRAIEEVRTTGGRVTVLSVLGVPLDPTVPRYFGTFDDISDREGAASTAPPEVVGHLTEARDVLATAGVDADLEWAAGEPGGVIVETARRIRADVVVIGEHHRGLLGRVFGADVDAAVEREAGCSVILA